MVVLIPCDPYDNVGKRLGLRLVRFAGSAPITDANLGERYICSESIYATWRNVWVSGGLLSRKLAKAEELRMQK